MVWPLAKRSFPAIKACSDSSAVRTFGRAAVGVCWAPKTMRGRVSATAAVAAIRQKSRRDEGEEDRIDTPQLIRNCLRRRPFYKRTDGLEVKVCEFTRGEVRP